MLDERLLAEATKVLAAQSYSPAVNSAPGERARLRKIRGISRFFGSGIWQGDLARMREDQPPRIGRRK